MGQAIGLVATLNVGRSPPATGDAVEQLSGMSMLDDIKLTVIRVVAA